MGMNGGVWMMTSCCCVMSAIVGGMIAISWMKMDNQQKSKKLTLGNKNSIVNNPTDSDMLIKEQLSRNIQFFGEEGQEKLENAFIIVVGVGGVGSHAAHMLARSGVRRLRFVDFDNVSLSSLNRHAVATREDVGSPKVVVLANHIKKFAPFCSIDTRNQIFSAQFAESLLEGNPTFVLDCIDDTNTKLDLLAYCTEHSIPVLSSMGAGAKADPTRLHFTRLSNVVRDPLASKLRSELKKRPQAAGMEQVEVLYSSEDPIMKLLPIADDEVDASELGTVPNFRVRIMPVFGTMPAIFGMAMASRVASKIAGKDFNPTTLPPLKESGVHKLLQRLGTRLMKSYPNDPTKSIQLIGDTDVECVVTQFHCKCAISRMKMNKGGGKMEIALWQYDRPCSVDNLVLCSQAGLKKLEELAKLQQVPTWYNLGISPEYFQDILEGLLALRSPETKRLARKYEKDVLAVMHRGIAHMNADHSEDCLNMCRVLGAVADIQKATMVHMDLLGMIFDVWNGNGEHHRCRVQFPSPVLEPSDIRKYAVALSKQCRP